MNIPNIYQGLEVEPPKPSVVEQIRLRGKVLSDNQFVFVPEYWEAQLKPYKKARWTHEKPFESTGWTTWGYGIKSGVFLVFTEFIQPLHGGFYATHLYSIVKEMKEGQVYGTFTEEGLILTRKVDGQTVQHIELKPRPMQLGDTPYHAILSY